MLLCQCDVVKWYIPVLMYKILRYCIDIQGIEILY